MLGLVGCTVASQLCGAFAFLIFANALSTSELGILSSALFLQQFFATMSISGLRSIVIREIVRQPDQRNAFAGSYLLLSGSIGLVIVFFTALITHVLPIGNDERFVYVAIAVGHVGACLIPNALFDAENRQVHAAAISTACELMFVVIIACFGGFGGLSMPLAAGLIAGKWIVSAIAGFWEFNRINASFRPTVNRSAVVILYKSAQLTSLATVLNVAPAAIGVVLTRVLFGSTQAGLFAIAAFVFRTHATLVGLLTRTIYPHVVGALGETVSFKARMLRGYLAYTLTLTGMGFICSELLLSYILRPEFQSSRWMIAIMLVAATIRVGGIIGNMYLIARFQERLLACFSVMSVAAFAIVQLAPTGLSGGHQTAFATLVAASVTLLSLIGLRAHPETTEATPEVSNEQC
ncbi:MAG: hypothetical protein P8L85_21410 [Rubripirellula sp.]|nr:hypothetical protein [Rubripirellula sp.]